MFLQSRQRPTLIIIMNWQCFFLSLPSSYFTKAAYLIPYLTLPYLTLPYTFISIMIVGKKCSCRGWMEERPCSHSLWPCSHSLAMQSRKAKESLVSGDSGPLSLMIVHVGRAQQQRKKFELVLQKKFCCWLKKWPGNSRPQFVCDSCSNRSNFFSLGD